MFGRESYSVLAAVETDSNNTAELSVRKLYLQTQKNALSPNSRSPLLNDSYKWRRKKVAAAAAAAGLLLVWCRWQEEEKELLFS